MYNLNNIPQINKNDWEKINLGSYIAYENSKLQFFIGVKHKNNYYIIELYDYENLDKIKTRKNFLPRVAKDTVLYFMEEAKNI